MPLRIALAGNPNCGKTTMFNALTGSNQYVGNRPGVTVEEKTGELKTHKGVSLVDLPGVYSLSPYTMEEVVTRNYLIDEHPDAIIDLVDASNIERNLYLTTQLSELGFPVVVALNMIDVAEKNGDKIDVDALSAMIKCKVVCTSALKGSGLAELCETAVAAAKSDENPTGICRFSDDTERSLTEIEALIADYAEALHLRWFAIKVFERDERVLKALDLPPEIQRKTEAIITAAERKNDDDSDSIIINERYDYITSIIKKCVVRHKSGTTAAEKVDNVMTNRFLALPLFLLIMCGVYYISVQVVGRFGPDFMNYLVEIFANGVTKLLTSIGTADMLISLIVDGFIGGVGSVLSFIPQLAVLFFFLAFLEDCGYMARIAFIMDRVFRRFGLSGKSFIPLLVASGCGVPGIMACRTIESERDRLITITVTTFVPCGAKLPVISMIAGAFFGQSAWVAISAYFIGILMVILSGVILKKTKFLADNPAPFIMELPSYHIPEARNVLKHVADELKAFVVKAGTIIFIACGIIWFLSNFSWNLRPAPEADSILAGIGGIVAPIFAPLGFGHWQTAVATITGLAAKENIVSSLTLLLGEGGSPSQYLSALSGFSFLIFNLLCSPCIAAIGAIRREMGSLKLTAFALLYQTLVAYSVSLIVYQLGGVLFFGAPFGGGAFAAVVIIAAGLYMLLRSYKTKD